MISWEWGNQFTNVWSKILTTLQCHLMPWRDTDNIHTNVDIRLTDYRWVWSQGHNNQSPSCKRYEEMGAFNDAHIWCTQHAKHKHKTPIKQSPPHKHKELSQAFHQTPWGHEIQIIIYMHKKGEGEWVSVNCETKAKCKGRNWKRVSNGWSIDRCTEGYNKKKACWGWLLTHPDSWRNH